jgi:hypothetical protein
MTLLINKGTREMNIQIEIIKENKDGSADALVHFDAEGLSILVEAGIISILRQYIEQEKNVNKRKKR